MTKRFIVIDDGLDFMIRDIISGDYLIDADSVVDILNDYEKENEQLKQFKSKVFNLLQDEIREESELLDYYLKEKAPYNADRQQIIIGVLKRLQKELQE